mmetsp:Transcript_13102/g.31057  ORF Transcript_13102/g.31057 Transcript_13102/m.31057 type:complete len:132 (+) Transcript_13102:98-493(+)
MSKPGKFSSRLMDMKFMKRAEERKEMKTALKRKSKSDAEAQWVAPQSTTENRRLAVITEGDPPPGALVGRFSFQSFSPATERLQAEAEERLQRVKDDQDMEGTGEETAVSDADMAKALSKRQRVDPPKKRE